MSEYGVQRKRPDGREYRDTVYQPHRAAEPDDSDMDWARVWALTTADFVEDGHWIRLGDYAFWTREAAQAEWDRMEAKEAGK